MYSFIMRPESLPKAYKDFIQKTGPVAAPVYKAVKDCCRGSPVDVASLHAYLSKAKGSNTMKLEEFPSIIPCSVIHPGTNSCLVHNANAAAATFRKTFPLYFSLTFVPFVVLRLQKVILVSVTPIFLLWFLVKSYSWAAGTSVKQNGIIIDPQDAIYVGLCSGQMQLHG